MARSVSSTEFDLRFDAAMMEAQDFETPDMPFIYTPLQGKEIRLLVLMVPGWTANEGEDDINCILMNLEPDLIPSYECLSYVWGPTDTDHLRVWCNRRSFLVSAGMLSALKCLRTLKTGNKGRKLLWIDQFCINQNDAVEKGKQVQRMAEIYQGADRVLLYPGLHPSFPLAAKFIFDFIDRFYWTYKDKSEGVFRQRWLHSSKEDLSNEYDIPLPEEEEWTAVRYLLSSPVFRRTWIWQELILAREIRIMINEQEYPFDTNCSLGFAELLNMHYERLTSPASGQYLEIEAREVMGLTRTRVHHRNFPRSSEQALLPLLCEIRYLEVTDPRDKVYGILSIANDAEKLGILPDYSASTAACYIDTARKLITKNQSLDVLICKETLRQIDGLPTWAPDWSCSMLENFENYFDEDVKLYNATKGLKLTIRNLKDGCKLGIQGIHIDTITRITTGVVDDELTGIREDLFGHGLWWLRAYSFIGPRYPHTSETLAQALGRTRLGDGHGENDDSAMKRDDLVDAKFYEVREDELPQDGPKTDQELRDLALLVTKVANMTCYRVLFTTVEKYMGLAPLTARIGDMIFLLPGANVPFVLRHVRDEEYELIGQCYTHGIMYGERADTGRLQDVTLL
ncbi:MAG: hypothetical protein Q9172_007730 [Xanthocarpia lactea]